MDSMQLRRQRRRATWGYAALGLAVGLGVAVAYDVRQSEQLGALARTRVESALRAPTAALRSAVERRVVLLEGLWSFAEAQNSREALNREFPDFARGLVLATDGVRALQFVEDGRIVSTYPMDGNQAALGYDLMSHPREEVREGVRRSMASSGIVITGPLELVQGGVGLLVRKRLTARPGFPDLAAIILDVPPIVRDAGLPIGTGEIAFELRDRSGRWVAGDPAGSAHDPVVATVSVPDGDWTVAAAPRAGWDAAIRQDLIDSRLASLGFVLALGLLGALVGQRQGLMAVQVAERQARLGVALRAGGMGTWELDVPGDILRFDDAGAAILGRSAQDASGNLERLFQMLHPEDAAWVAKSFLEVLRSDRNVYTLEHRALLPDETPRWVFVTGEIERDASGQALRAHGIIADASDRRAMEARSRQLERVETIGTMAGGVAHDFNNLLAAMVTCTEMALEEARTPPPARSDADIEQFLEEVLRTAARAQGLTKQLLAFSRGSASEPRRCDVRLALVEMEPLLRRMLGDRIGLEIAVADAVPAVWIDPSQLTQVVLNLIVNARDAIPERGSIRVRLGSTASGQVRLEVEDTGIGMSDEVLRRMFEPYFTTKASGRGTGLGLSVVQGVVRNAGGEVSARSQIGVGTTITVTLPGLDATTAPSAPA